MGIKIEAGNYYVIGFGKGTQLIYVYEISKTGKRGTISRCQQWRSDNPVWLDTLSTIKVQDDRLQEKLDRNPVPTQPRTLAACKAAKAATKAADARRPISRELRAKAIDATEAADIQTTVACTGDCLTSRYHDGRMMYEGFRDGMHWDHASNCDAGKDLNTQRDALPAVAEFTAWDSWDAGQARWEADYQSNLGDAPELLEA